MNLSPAQKSLIDRVCDGDSRWFADHPEATRRLRLRVPDEFAPRESDIPPSQLTLVVQVAPGARLRTPVPLVEIASS